MARAKAVLLAGLLLACLAADVLAKPAPVKTKAKATAVYDCPDTPRFKGCAASGCALHMHGRTSTLICAECKSEKAYVLVNDGTRKAQCECAAGYAGKGQDGVCKKCPAGTDIAEGGAIAKSVCTKCPEGTFVNEAGTDCVCPAGTYKAASPDQPAGYKKMECKPCAARNAYVDTDGHSRDSCKVCTAPMLSNKDHTKCVMPDSPDAAPPGDGLLDALSQSPLGGLAQAFEEGRQQVRGQRVKGETPSPFKSLASRVRNAVRRDSPAAAEEQEDEYVEVEEAPTKAATKTGKKAAAAEDVDVEIDQAVDQDSEENSNSVSADVESTTTSSSKHGSSHASKGDSHKEKDYTYGQHNKKEGHHKKHHAEEEEEVEDEEESYASKKYSKEAEHEEYEKHASHSGKDKDTPSHKEEEKDSYSKPTDKKSYYEKRAASQSQSQGESDSQYKAEQQQQATKPAEPKAAAEGSSSKQGTSGRSTAADQPEQKENTLGRAGDSKRPKSRESRKMPPTKADPDVVKDLIPGLPVEMDEQEQETLLKKQAAAEAKQPPTRDAKAPTPAAAPAGPVTLKDIAKKLGAAFGATAPVANPMGNPMGFIDPEALADAGLPPVNNVGQLMGALMKRQMADLDIGDFAEHITPHGGGGEGGFM